MRLWQKVVYGSGDWSIASFNTFRQVFYPVFLTNVVGLDPRLASLASLTGIAWDAVNDPLIGALSDGVRTPLGRRRPFLLAFAIPFGAAFAGLWWAPVWESQASLAVHAAAMYVLTDTLQTLVSVPFYALLPELSKDYDERTAATAWRMFFNLAASLAVVVGAPVVVQEAATRGVDARQVWLVTGGLFGLLGTIPPLLIGGLLREAHPAAAAEETPGFLETFRQAMANPSFRWIVPIYLLAFTTFDLAGLMIPYFVTWHLNATGAQGPLSIGAVSLPIESGMLGSMMIVAIAALPVWAVLSSRFGKSAAIRAGCLLWAACHVAIGALASGGWTAVAVAAVTGIGVSCAHVIPDAMLPDVIDEDELRTGRRNEGVYYGARNLFRKASGALAVFFALQTLGWCGYDGQSATQPPAALSAIRFLIGPFSALLVAACALVSVGYPLTRERHAEIRRQLALTGRTPPVLHGPP